MIVSLYIVNGRVLHMVISQDDTKHPVGDIVKIEDSNYLIEDVVERNEYAYQVTVREYYARVETVVSSSIV